MMLKTMADIRADLTKQGFDDHFIRAVITQRIDIERQHMAAALRAKRVQKSSVPTTQKYICPQQRQDNAIIAGTHAARGLIMVGEW